MAQSIDDLNKEIDSLRKQLGKQSLSPFDQKDLQKAKEALSGLRNELREMDGDLNYISKSFKDSVAELSKQNAQLTIARNSIKGISNLARDLVDFRKGENDLSEKQLKNIQRQSKIKFDDLQYTLRSGKLTAAQAAEVRETLAQQTAFNKSLERTIDIQEEVNKEIGLMGAGLEGAGKFLEKMGFTGIAKPISDAIQATKKARFELKLNQDAIQAIKDEYETLGPLDIERKKELREQLGHLNAQNKELDKQTNKYKNIASALKEQLTSANLMDGAIALLTKNLISFDKFTGETAKNMGISYTQAVGLSKEFNSISMTTMNTFVTTKALSESYNQINQALGTNATLSEDILVTQTELVKQAGYSVEAATMLSKLSLATGKPTKDIAASFLGQAKALNLVNGTAINEKQLLEDVSSLSKDTLATFADQPGRLAEAAYEARKLGLDLNKLKSTQSSLLDIESSIASEFEAEVLTGKQLNLEKARYFALTNDYAGLARELQKQDITRASFGKMNVIQQEATAKALGMTAETMGGMLMDQEAMSKLSGVEGKTAKEKFDNLVKEVGLEEAKKRLGDETLANQMASTSTQERFAALTEKLQEAFMGIAGPIMEIVSPLLDLVSSVLPAINLLLSPLIEGFSLIGKGVTMFVDGLKEANPLAITLAATMGILSFNLLKSAIAGIWTTLSEIPFGVGLALAGVATAGLISMVGKASSMKDGVIDPKKGPVVSGGFGSVQLDPKDQIVAGTNLMPNGGRAPQQSQAIDYDKMAQAMSRVKVQTNLDGVNVSRNLQTPMGIATRKL
jgi:hypothetical protein